MKALINYSELFGLMRFKMRKYLMTQSEALKSAWKDIKQSLTAVTTYPDCKGLNAVSQEHWSYYTGNQLGILK